MQTVPALAAASRMRIPLRMCSKMCIRDRIVDGPISGEVKATTTDAEGMIKEGREIAAIHPNMVVKIPMTVEGLKAVKVLSAEGIKTNVTLIFSANQALLAARAGATYVDVYKRQCSFSSNTAVRTESSSSCPRNFAIQA